MPEHLRALAVILVLASGVFAMAKPHACAAAMSPDDFARRRNLWFGVTLSAFLAHDFWLYIAAAAILLFVGVRREWNPLALFFFVLFAVPAIPDVIPGFGPVRYFFSIDYLRLLALAVLLPAFFSLVSQPGPERFGQSLADKLIAAYLALLFLLRLPDSSFTDTLRNGVLYGFTDIFLPYYVASRALKDLQGFRDALSAFVVAALVLSALAVFEFAKRWLLYMALEDALGAHWFGIYLARGEALRAQASTGQPIILGYVLAVAFGLFHFLRASIGRTAWRLGWLLLAMGLVAALSRGPWLGAAAMLVLFVALGPAPAAGLTKLGAVGGLVALALLALPGAQHIVDYLPFVGTVDAENVIYRERLLEICLDVIRQNLLFGVPDFMQLPVMQQLRQGQGIIDIVNTYLAVALESGVVGLSLFAGLFGAVAVGIFVRMRGLPDKDDERYLLGRALLATLVGMLVIIAAASSLGLVPLIYWSVAGLGVAYVRVLALGGVQQAAAHRQILHA